MKDLFSGAAYPLMFHKKDQIVYVMAEHDLSPLREGINVVQLKDGSGALIGTSLR